MLTQAEKAMKKNEWIVFLGWTPHPVMGEMKIAYLDGMGDSGFGAATVFTNVRAGLLAECPNVGKLLTNLKFNLAMEGAMMAPVLKDGADPKATALAWLKANPGCGEALARRRHDLRRQGWAGGRAGCSQVISSL